jgi:hypothetical protein
MNFLGALACRNSYNGIWVAGGCTHQDATFLRLVVCPVYLRETPLHEGSESEGDCLQLMSAGSCKQNQTCSHEKGVNGVDDRFRAQLVYDED